MTDTATWPAPAPSAMTPVPYRVRSRIAENRDSSTLQLEPLGEPLPAPLPGEFMMMYAFGIGEVAISVSGVPPEPTTPSPTRSARSARSAEHCTTPKPAP